MSFFPDTCDPSEAPNNDTGTCPNPDYGYVGILNKSDVYAGLVATIQNYIGISHYGSGGLAMPALMATVVSAASRALTQYAVGFGGKGSYLPVATTGLTPTTSNLMFIGVFNAVIAFLMKRNVPRQMLIGMEIDSLGYSVMQNVPFMSNKDTIIFGYQRT